jgi:uncharacterized protein (DUF1684 family)
VESSEALELVDWRRQVAELFAALRARVPDAETVRWFREGKDTLFRTHPQSPIPLENRSAFGGLSYWPHDPSLRVTAQFEPRDVEPAGADQAVLFERIGDLHFMLQGESLMLPALWIVGYGGGLFVPFRDGTSGHETYGGGRYALDTIKSADLGGDPASSTVILDFNYAYHPSCVYDPRWVCPLAPPESRLAIPIRAGERLP